MALRELHKAYDENPICPCCYLAISQEYIKAHLDHDHTEQEKALALARIAVEDYQEMYEFVPDMEGKAEPKEA